MASFLTLYPLLMLLHTVTSNSSILFGIHAEKNTNSIVTLTLFWAGDRFQCNVYPTYHGSFFCNTSNTSTTSRCDTSLSPNPIEYGLQIDNDWDPLIIENIIIKQMNDNNLFKLHSIDFFCLNISLNHTEELTDKQQQSHCIDSKYTYSILTMSDEHDNDINNIMIPLNISGSSIDESNVQIPNETARCIPNGYACNVKNDNNANCASLHKYILVETDMNWFDAQEYCAREYSSSLATVISDDDLKIAVAIRENDDIYFEEDIWIGLTDNYLTGSTEGKWEWIDGTSCDYTNTRLCKNDNHWGYGEPNDDDGEDCAAIKHQYTFGWFNDINCRDEEHIFFCKNGEFVEITSTMELQPTLNNLTVFEQKHFDGGDEQFLMVIGIIVAVFMVIVAGGICCCLYYRKFIKDEIRKETERLNSKETDNDIDELGKCVENNHIALVQPGSFPMIEANDEYISSKSLDGYNRVKNKEEEESQTTDDEEMKEDEIVIVRTTSNIEGYVKETKLDNNSMDDELKEVLNINSIPKMENIIENDNKCNSSDDSDDMYDDKHIIKEKITQTMKGDDDNNNNIDHEMYVDPNKNINYNDDEKINLNHNMKNNEYHIVENNEESNSDEMYENPKENDKNDNNDNYDETETMITALTAGHIDGNTIGNIDEK